MLFVLLGICVICVIACIVSLIVMSRSYLYDDIEEKYATVFFWIFIAIFILLLVGTYGGISNFTQSVKNTNIMMYQVEDFDVSYGDSIDKSSGKFDTVYTFSLKDIDDDFIEQSGIVTKISSLDREIDVVVKSSEPETLIVEYKELYDWWTFSTSDSYTYTFQ